MSLAQTTITTTDARKIMVAAAFTSGVIPRREQPPDLKRQSVLPPDQEEGHRNFIQAEGEHEQAGAEDGCPDTGKGHVPEGLPLVGVQILARRRQFMVATPYRVLLRDGGNFSLQWYSLMREVKGERG
jgi:hypothetical protein